jgi:hypothetical protein
MVDKLFDANRVQYSKLLALERKEMMNQKEISDTWVKYIYLLLEYTMKHSKENNILFHNLDEYQQTLVLRSRANELRKYCNLPAYEVIYDPLDASIIVNNISNSVSENDPIFSILSPSRTAEEVSIELEIKYGDALKNIAALRGTV